MTEHSSHDVGIYYKVFGGLLVLTVVTVAANRVHLAIPLAVTVALIIAITKGSLVAAYFMHLISESSQIYRVLILTVIFLFLLMFMPLLGLFSTPAGTEHRTPLTPAAHATAEGHR